MRSFIEKIKRMIYWAWTLRDNHDFDYGFVEEMLRLKLRRLKWTLDTCQYHKNLQDLYKDLSEMDENTPEFDKRHTLEQIQCYRALDIVIAILERRKQYDFYDDLVGLSKFMDTYTNADRLGIEKQLDMNTSHKIELSKEAYWSKLKPLMNLSNEIEERDKKWMYDLLRMYSAGWWN